VATEEIFMRRTLKYVMLSALVAVFSGQAFPKVNAVATTTMVADMVRNVGGDKVEVAGLMGPGVDPHLYKATSRDLKSLKRADVIFYSGLHLEGRLGDVFTRMGRRGIKVYAVSESVDRALLLEPAEFAGHYDPHIWFNPALWATCIKTVVEALGDVDPENAEVYQRNGAELMVTYEALHVWALQKITEVPKECRILITSHDAFNYFGQAYGFQVVGVQGISTVSEAGLADIARTVDFIREKKVPAIFVESSVSPAAIERISKDSGAHIGGELFSDAMGTPGVIHSYAGEEYDEGTYIGMVKNNVRLIVEALK
jgi:manganese/zinc/iron transport system substrate-binding protein